MDSIPLDMKTTSVFDKTKQQNVECAALDPRRVEKLEIRLYQTLPDNSAEEADIDEWLEHCSIITQDLTALLAMPHDLFWCHVIYEESLRNCLDSYLKLAPRYYDVNFTSIKPQLKEPQQNLHKLFFMVLLRMATHKESKDHHITPEVFGQILYDNFIFDIPKIMDICVLYGKENHDLVVKMIGNIFKAQPRYTDDLHPVATTLLEVVGNICENCGLVKPVSPGKMVIESKVEQVSLLSMPLPKFQDILFYLCDIAETLRMFLDIYPVASDIFYDVDAHVHLASLYENLVVVLNENFQKRDFPDGRTAVKLQAMQKHFQLGILKSVRQIIYSSCLDPLLKGTSVEAANGYVEKYIHTMSCLLSEFRFIAHYAKMFPFAPDADIICQTSQTDETSIDFIANGMDEALAKFGMLMAKKFEKQASASANVEEVGSLQYQYDDPSMMGACAMLPEVSEIELESMISAVKDLLPDLGDGFIELCLQEYVYETDKVINAILEGNLPVSLQNVDQMLPRKKKLQQVDVEVVEGPMSNRRNIYDNDEFDVFTRKDVDTSKIHKGKKSKVTASELEDKSYITALKSLYDKYGNESGSPYDKVIGNDYDDEYDDTYDSNVVGVDDADSADELTARRPFTTPRVFNTKQESEESDEEEENTEQGTSKPSRDEFITNPALIRERMEQRRLQNQRKPTSNKQYDVQGGPKGQGQSSDVLRNRAWKEKNRSTRVHHNRKNLADKKRVPKF